MPALAGEHLIRELRKVRMDVPIVLMSGYGEREMVGRFATQGLAGFLHKPFRLKALLQQVTALTTTPGAV
jgi:two-component system, cell cycle sensor histidine kinase and response regulator CckA